MPGPAQCRSASAHLQSRLSVTLYLASSCGLPHSRFNSFSSLIPVLVRMQQTRGRVWRAFD